MAEEVAPCTGTTCAASPCAQGQAEVPRAAAWTQSSANSAPLISAVMPSIHRRAHQAQHALLALQVGMELRNADPVVEHRTSCPTIHMVLVLLKP